MYNEAVITGAKAYVRETLEGEGSGHDWWHIHRVHNLAIHLQKHEGGNLFVIELAA